MASKGDRGRGTREVSSIDWGAGTVQARVRCRAQGVRVSLIAPTTMGGKWADGGRGVRGGPFVGAEWVRRGALLIGAIPRSRAVPGAELWNSKNE